MNKQTTKHKQKDKSLQTILDYYFNVDRQHQKSLQHIADLYFNVENVLQALFILFASAPYERQGQESLQHIAY